MKKMKRIAAWMLGLTMLLLFCTAAAESGLPEIPAFAGKLNVRPIATEEEAIEYAKEIWALDYLGMDFPISFYKVSQYEPDVWTVYAKDGPDDGDYCYGDVLFDLDGNVIRVENASSGFFEVAIEEETLETGENTEAEIPENADEQAAWHDDLDRKLEFPFLAAVCPSIYEEYTALYPVGEGDNEFLTYYYDTYVDSYNHQNVFDVDYSERYRDGTWRIHFGVQTSPVIRIVYFDVYGDPEEGGNG